MKPGQLQHDLNKPFPNIFTIDRYIHVRAESL